MRFCFLILAMFLVIPAIAQKNENEIKLNAILEAGIDINNRVNTDRTDYNKIGYGKIEISARPVKKVRGEFGLEFDKGDSSFIIDKLYAQYNFTDFSGVRIGYMKKAFGFEEKAGLEERYFHRRSIINDNLEDFGLLDHDLTFQYRHKLSENWRAIGAFSWGEDSTRYYQNYSVEYETPNINLALAGIIGHYTHTDYDLTAWAASLSFKYTAKLFVSETEITFGNNPVFQWADSEDAFILGLRAQEYFPMDTKFKGLRQIIPIAEAALYSRDIESKDIDIQLRAGLTFGFAKNSAFQWRNTYGTVTRIRNDEKELRRRRFDSEVVVIF
jgi:hypothetical protein